MKPAFSLLMLLLLLQTNFAQKKFYEPYSEDSKDFTLSDFGKMWTFNSIPKEYFKNEYNFEPSDEWIENVQKSALQFGWGCSGAFVSENGLILTNHHCGRGAVVKVQKHGEDLLKNGFYSESKNDERKVPGLFVDQLMLIEDVTIEVNKGLDKEEALNDKADIVKQNIAGIEEDYKSSTGLKCRVVKLYNGGKYFLYGYKRYNDIRLVMAPDFQIASTGWDWDNFTYPRYELDFAFFRAYENDEPVKTEHFFKWSEEGINNDEPIFVVGRPGNTDRQLTINELKFKRDKIYPRRLKLLNGIYSAYSKMFSDHPEDESKYLNGVMGAGNSRKVYAGMIQGLNNPTLIDKKIKFENELAKNSKVNRKYSEIKLSINKTLNELEQIVDSLSAYQIYMQAKPIYLTIAEEVINKTGQLNSPNIGQDENYNSESLEEAYPKNIDKDFQRLILEEYLDYLTFVLGGNNSFLNKIDVANKSADEVLSSSDLSTYERYKSFISNPETILSSNDPFINIVIESKRVKDKFSSKKKELGDQLNILNQQLGELIFQAYGNSIPPDATSTLRISDGKIKGYEYNGTIAPPYTTYYGMYDRYNSFGGNTYPWGLNKRWVEAIDEIDMSIPLNFVSTNDIVGGNSGSSAINKDGEVVGLIFDGNIESLNGNFIYLPEQNRAIGINVSAIIEALTKVYKTKPLVDELLK